MLLLLLLLLLLLKLPKQRGDFSKQRSTVFIGGIISTFFCLFRHLPHPLKKNSGQKSVVVVSFSLSLSLSLFFLLRKLSSFCFVFLFCGSFYYRHTPSSHLFFLWEDTRQKRPRLYTRVWFGFGDKKREAESSIRGVSISDERGC